MIVQLILLVCQIGICCSVICGNFSSIALTPKFLCGNFIDYDFVLPAGQTPQSLDLIAANEVKDKRIAILPTKCQLALKKLVCSNVFLRCTQESNYHIFSDFGISIPMPFKRPCQSVCALTNSDCYGVLKLMRLSQDCSARFDYSHGAVTNQTGHVLKPYQYDSSNNASICNAMAMNVEVGGTMEPYMGHNTGGVCDGIITELYIPPANRLSSSLAPLQPPGVVQSFIEAELSTSLKSLPVWLSEKCHFALKKYFCGSYMLKPQAQVIGEVFAADGFSASPAAGALLRSLGVNVTALMSYMFYLPSYPDQQVCVDYESSCSEFISLANVPLLTPKCNSTQNGTTIKRYPMHNQTIFTLALSVGSNTVPLPFKTHPNYMDEATHDNSYATQCPEGFVVPDDPTDALVTWVKGTGCAMQCETVLWTPQEWHRHDMVAKVLPAVSLPAIIILLLLWVLDSNRRKQYLIICFALTSGLGCLTFILMLAYQGQSGLCKNNAVPITQSDGPSMCVFQGLIVAYSALACCLSWLMQAADLYLRVVKGMRTDGHWKIHVPIIFGLPIIPAAYFAGKGVLGFGQLVPWCFITSNDDVAWLYAPILIITILGVMFMARVFAKIMFTLGRTLVRTSRQIEPSFSVDSPSNASSNVTTNPANVHINVTVTQALTGSAAMLQNLRLLTTPIIFLLAFLVVWVTLFMYRGLVYFNRNKYTSAVIDWVKCIFQHYDGNNATWQQVCGVHASHRANDRLVEFVMFCCAGQSLLIFAIFIVHASTPSSVMYCLQKLGWHSAPYQNGTGAQSVMNTTLASRRDEVDDLGGHSTKNLISENVDALDKEHHDVEQAAGVLLA